MHRDRTKSADTDKPDFEIRSFAVADRHDTSRYECFNISLTFRSYHYVMDQDKISRLRNDIRLKIGNNTSGEDADFQGFFDN